MRGFGPSDVFRYFSTMHPKTNELVPSSGCWIAWFVLFSAVKCFVKFETCSEVIPKFDSKLHVYKHILSINQRILFSDISCVLFTDRSVRKLGVIQCQGNGGKFSIWFWRQYVTLFASIAAIVSHCMSRNIWINCAWRFG